MSTQFSDLTCPQCGEYLALSVVQREGQSGIKSSSTVQRENDARPETHAAPQGSVESAESGDRKSASIFDRFAHFPNSEQDIS